MNARAFLRAQGAFANSMSFSRDVGFTISILRDDMMCSLGVLKC